MDNKNTKKNNVNDFIKKIENEIEEELDIYDIYSVMKYIKTHYIKFLLLILAIAIIVIVDYITGINSRIFAMPSPIPGLPNNQPTNNVKKTKQSKKVKK